MSSREILTQALAPVLEVVGRVDLSQPAQVALLEAELPLDGPVLTRVAALLREGVEAGWVCDREAGGVRFSRVLKAEGAGISIDAVHMDQAGPGHLHPNGEIDLCFAVSGSPTFDGRAPGWTIYPPGSWHVPTVAGGVMDILYFLPGGAIQFGPRPA